MMEVQMYLPDIIKWEHAPQSEFMGENEDYQHHYILGITPPDPTDSNFILMNVFVEKEVKNTTKKTIPFYCKVFYCFRVKNEGRKPTAEFYFALIEQTTVLFQKLFAERVKGTNMEISEIHPPNWDELKDSIEKTIDSWDRLHRKTSLN
jgi:hypothetical protein